MNEAMQNLDQVIDELELELTSLRNDNRRLDQQARRARLALIQLIGVHSTERQLEIIDKGLDG